MELDRAQKIGAVERATVESLWTRADTRIIQGLGWTQTITLSDKSSRFNRVAQCTLPNEAQADSRIDEALQFYRSQGISFQWTVGPSSLPFDLAKRLETRGMRLKGEVAGMVADVSSVLNRCRIAQNLSVESVDPSDERSVDDWAKTSVLSWGEPSSSVPERRDGMLRFLKELKGSIFYVLARVDGRPAGTGILRLTRMGGYLVGGAVKPEFRRQGVYEALIKKRLQILQEMGVPLAITQADEKTAAPICLRLGFEEVCKLRIYEGLSH